MLIVSRSARDDAPDGYDEGDIDADSINTELSASKDTAHLRANPNVRMAARAPLSHAGVIVDGIAAIVRDEHVVIMPQYLEYSPCPSASADAMGDAWNAPSTTTSLTTTRDTSGYMGTFRMLSTHSLVSALLYALVRCQSIRGRTQTLVDVAGNDEGRAHRPQIFPRRLGPFARSSSPSGLAVSERLGDEDTWISSCPPLPRRRRSCSASSRLVAVRTHKVERAAEEGVSGDGADTRTSFVDLWRCHPARSLILTAASVVDEGKDITVLEGMVIAVVKGNVEGRSFATTRMWARSVMTWLVGAMGLGLSYAAGGVANAAERSRATVPSGLG
ncbi:hypothetical protein EV714DRAFT_240443 [Schizophyllum commune]